MSGAGIRYVPAPDVVSTVLDGEAVLLNVSTGMYYSLNSTASEVWERLDQGAAQEELASHLLDAFEVSSDQADQDVSMLLAELVSKQLVQPVR